MKNFLFNIGILCLSFTVLTFTACNDDDDNTVTDPDIVEFVSDNQDFSVLAQAVVRANLDGVLSGAGPFTVFAPDNNAFQALLDSNPAWNTLEDIPVDVLAAVLTNHVVAGDVRSTDLDAGYYPTLSGLPYGSDVTTSLYVNLDNGVTLNGVADVTQADVEVDNGVIHVIDEVITLPDIVTFATSNPGFSALVSALTADGLSTDFVTVLSGEGPFTVFAPTNEAFQALLDSNDNWNTVADIPANVLENVLLYHVTDAGNVRSTDLTDEMMVSTLAGETFTIDLDGGASINAGQNSANIIATDVQATNGVIHVIDTVILPE